jgi:hypothetical protein
LISENFKDAFEFQIGRKLTKIQSNHTNAANFDSKSPKPKFFSIIASASDASRLEATQTLLPAKTELQEK